MTQVFAAIVALLAVAVLVGMQRRTTSRIRAGLARERAALQTAYAELQLAKTQAEFDAARLKATLSGMTDGVMMFDSERRLMQWNDHFPGFTGVPPALLQVGRPLADMLRAQAEGGEFGPLADIGAEVLRRLAALSTDDIPEVTERQRPDGSFIQLRRRLLPDGGVVTLYTDVTSQRQAEAAQAEIRRATEAAMAQKSQFVAMVSHEIRVPLNAVISSLALLGQSQLSAGQRSLAETARQSGDTLLDLLDDILELSKVDAGKLELRAADFELAPMLVAVRDMFAAQAGQRGIRIAIKVEPGLPPRLHGDVGRLRQVLMNFVSNAAKFASPGEVVISASLDDTAGPTPRLLRLSVQDPGPPIPPAEASQLFQPFARLEARSAGVAGTGLGLAICARLAELMGGQVGHERVEPGSGVRAGNRFWVTARLQRPALDPVLRPEMLPPRPPRRTTVLLVEDIATNRVLAATLLRRQGHRVDTAEDGETALALVQSAPYDVVFMDLLMPGIGGVEAARQIRALPGVERLVPVVALTAGDTPDVQDMCVAAGMNALLAKPVRPAALAEMVARMIATPGSAKPETEAEDLLDGERIADLQRGLPPGMFASLVESCLSDIAARMPQLRTALKNEDANAAHAAAHALAGMAGGYGLAALEHKLRGAMEAASRGELGAAGKALGPAGAGSVEQCFDRSTVAIQALLRNRAA